MRNARKLITALFAVLGVLGFASAPALAVEGYGYQSQLTGFTSPSAVAFDSSGDVYVADAGADSVDKFNASGAPVGFSGSASYISGSKLTGAPAGPGGEVVPFGSPQGVAVDGGGSLYVTDSSNRAVYVFNGTTGIYERELTGIAFGDPYAVTVNQATGDVYIDDFGTGVVDVFNSLGVYQSQFGGGTFRNVRSLAVNESTGEVYVAESSSDVVYVFSSSGTLQSTWTGGGSGPGGGTPQGSFGGEYVSVAVEQSTGRVFVGVSRVGVVDEFDSAGTYLTQVTGRRTPRESLVEDGTPIGLAVAPGGDLYAIDNAAEVVDVFAFGPRPETPEALPPEKVTSTGATFRAKLKPVATELKYYFEYNIGSSCASGVQTSFKEGEEEVKEAVTGLEPNAEYTYCIVAENKYGPSEAGPLLTPFKTPPAPPAVIGESASSVEKQAVQFAAVINPENRETTYSFEYSYSKATVEEGKGEVAGGGAIPAGFGDEPVASSVVEELEQKLLKTKETIYYRVVAENEEGKGTPIYGDVEAYTKLPLVENEQFSALTSISAKLEATVNPVFSDTRYAFEYATGEEGKDGKEMLEKGEGTLVGAGSVEAEGVPLPVSTEIVGLQPGHTYFYRAVAINEVTEHEANANDGKPVRGQIEEITPYAAPAATTGDAGAITGTSATLSGEVDPKGYATSYSFQYISEAAYQAAEAKGESNLYAEGEATTPVSAGSGETTETVGPILVPGLRPGVTYHYRLVATNRSGVQGMGGDRTFTTGSASLPLVSTGPASGVTQNGATLSGTVTTNGLQTSYGFEIGTSPGNYGPATGLGAIGGAQTEEVHVTLSELQPGTTYYDRVTATNADGTAQGEPGTFTTPGFPSLLAAPVSPPQIATPGTAFPTDVTESATPGKTKTKAKPKTRAQKLAKALKQCHKQSRKSRAECERQAHGRYGAAKKKK